MSLPINLNYSSAQFDYSYGVVYGTQSPYPGFLTKSLTGDTFGGWSLTPYYQFYQEFKPALNSNGNNCSSTNGVVRTSLVMPDGARHILYFPGFPQGFQSNDGYFPWAPDGSVACTEYTSISGVIHLFTTDGSFIRYTWDPSTGYGTVALPDRTTISSPNYSGYPETITDRNGNKISITNTALGGSPLSHCS